MSILPQITAWSRERPLWQQDSLRQLVEQPTLTDADHTALLSLCKLEHGLPVPDAPAPEPLSGLAPAAALPEPAPTVRLKGIHGARKLNALRDDQHLTIATTGVTVVYGDNGAGKSGYVRALKQVCCARGDRDAVHANVFGDNPQPASAVVTHELEARAAEEGAAPGPEDREML